MYKICENVQIDGAFWCGKYEKGEWVDLKDKYSQDIIDREFEGNWESHQLQLEIVMDNEKYPEIFSALNDITYMYFSENELTFLEDMREEGLDSLLLAGVDWDVNNLREVQEYLDELNRALAPIISECYGNCEGNWYLNGESFGVATWEWTDKGFRIIGTEV